MRNLLQSSPLKRAATLTSLIFSIMVSATIVHGGFTALRIEAAKEEQARVEALERQAEKLRQLICLTNVVHHEARGEIAGVRKLVGKVVLAMAADRFYSRAKSVCDLAKIKGTFSQIKHIENVRANEKLWPQIYHEMSEVMDEGLMLPAGWACVRAFRVSDDKMEKLSDKALKQLGFTVSAKGLKYFAKELVPVDTRGSITFYSKRGGCKLPMPTTQAAL